MPTLDFNIYLTGYDVQTINLRDVFHGTCRRPPRPARTRPTRSARKGDFSQDINFASCSGLLPPPHAAGVVRRPPARRSPARPRRSSAAAAPAATFGDNIARGYVTVDTVNNCTLRFPGDPGYFGRGRRDRPERPLGRLLLRQPGGRTSPTATPWSASRRSATDPGPRSPGSTPSTAATSAGRPPTTASRWPPTSPPATSTAAPFTGGTDLIVWRDSKVNQGPFTCPATLGRPSWYPLGQEAIVIFDEQEQPQVPQSLPGLAAAAADRSSIPFPAEAQRDSRRRRRPAGAVQLRLALPRPEHHGRRGRRNPPEDPAAAQAWVTIEMKAQGRFSVGFDAIQLDSACLAAPLHSGRRPDP